MQLANERKVESVVASLKTSAPKLRASRSGPVPRTLPAQDGARASGVRRIDVFFLSAPSHQRVGAVSSGNVDSVLFSALLPGMFYGHSGFRYFCKVDV